MVAQRAASVPDQTVSSRWRPDGMDWRHLTASCHDFVNGTIVGSASSPKSPMLAKAPVGSRAGPNGLILTPKKRHSAFICVLTECRVRLSRIRDKPPPRPRLSESRRRREERQLRALSRSALAKVGFPQSIRPPRRGQGWKHFGRRPPARGSFTAGAPPARARLGAADEP